MNYHKALSETDPKIMKLMERDSRGEIGALAKFSDFYAVFSSDVVERNITKLYAPNAYFRDPIRDVQGIDNIRIYFLHTTKTFHECRFDIQDIVNESGEYYFRWMMHLKTKRKPKEEILIPGMSHVRFDSEGMIIFHNDYWDINIIFERFPLIGPVLRWIKSRI